MNAAVEKYLKPFLIGKPADRIDDTLAGLYNSSYWRNGPVLNNAISGVDQALWDIKGRQAGMPVYQLLGGKCREAADCYSHASGDEIAAVHRSARASSWRRDSATCACRSACPAWRATARDGAATAGGQALHAAPVFEPAFAIRRAMKLFEECRKQLGDEIELLHDMHERYHAEPGRAVRQGRGEVQAVLPGGPALARGHRVLPPDPPAMRDAASPWASCSTARTSGRRSSPSA